MRHNLPTEMCFTMQQYQHFLPQLVWLADVIVTCDDNVRAYSHLGNSIISSWKKKTNRIYDRSRRPLVGAIKKRHLCHRSSLSRDTKTLKRKEKKKLTFCVFVKTVGRRWAQCQLITVCVWFLSCSFKSRVVRLAQAFVSNLSLVLRGRCGMRSSAALVESWLTSSFERKKKNTRGGRRFDDSVMLHPRHCFFFLFRGSNGLSLSRHLRNRRACRMRNARRRFLL